MRVIIIINESSLKLETMQWLHLEFGTVFRKNLGTVKFVVLLKGP